MTDVRPDVRSTSLAGLVVVAAWSTTAGASPLSDALARHGDAELATLRTQQGDAAARCTLGAIYAKRNDLPRAALYLTGCQDVALPVEIAAPVLQIVRDVKHRLDASRFSALDVMSQPEGLTAEIDALPGESFTTPATVWVAPGSHQIRATLAERSWTQRVTTEPRKNTLIVIETGLGVPPPAPRTSKIDFVQDDPGGALGEHHTGPPPDIKHPSLLKDKYRGIPDPTSEGPIDDPLAARATSAAERDVWLGARLGAGLFDDGSAAARAGVAVALAGRYRLTDAMFAAARADWSRRGGEVMTGTIDVLGASAGVGLTVLGRSAQPASPQRSGLALALIAQLRGDLRLTDMRAAAPVHRAGLSVAAGAELALPATPFTVGLRFEQGVTELVAGARDRAVLAEIGIDLR
jgi:hypothetical protein